MNTPKDILKSCPLIGIRTDQNSSEVILIAHLKTGHKSLAFLRYWAEYRVLRAILRKNHIIFLYLSHMQTKHNLYIYMWLIDSQHSILCHGNTVLQYPSPLTCSIVSSVFLIWFYYLHQMCFESPAIKVISIWKNLILFICKHNPGSIIKINEWNLSGRNMGNCQVNILEYWGENVAGEMYLVI